MLANSPSVFFWRNIRNDRNSASTGNRGGSNGRGWPDPSLRIRHGGAMAEREDRSSGSSAADGIAEVDWRAGARGRGTSSDLSGRGLITDAAKTKTRLAGRAF